MSIVTFYSYKGGVGRSMALANIATLLSQRGKRVLAVDWDLEAPGLERYFSYFNQESASGGLLPFLSSVSSSLSITDSNASKYKHHAWTIHTDRGAPIELLPSGRQSTADYSAMLHEFDWRSFFAKGGGDFLETLRDHWKREYDYVLIDSRTGMSDSGGICTIQLPDVLVGMATPNEQSMQGLREIIDAVQAGRQRLAFDRMPLTVLPIACRIPSDSELREAQIWIERFADTFEGVCDDWLPSWVELRDVFEKLKVPQVDWFSFGERLASVELGASDPRGMAYGYDRVTDLIASEFADLKGALGESAIRPADYSSHSTGRIRVPNRHEYLYDIFVSYRSGGALSSWTRTFVAALEEWLELDVPELRVFFDSSGLEAHAAFNETRRTALERSKLMLAVLTPPYFASEVCAEEWAYFATLEQRDSTQQPRLQGFDRILPIVVRGWDSYPKPVRERTLLDGRAAFEREQSITLKGSGREYSSLINIVSERIVALLRDVPPLSPDLKIVVTQEDVAALRPGPGSGHSRFE